MNNYNIFGNGMLGLSFIFIIFWLLASGGIIFGIIFTIVKIVKSRNNTNYTNNNSNYNTSYQEVNILKNKVNKPQYIKCEYCNTLVKKGETNCPNCGASVNYK